nr:ethanolamine utilization protein [Colletotrichum truncatum]KAF6788054.1 ethanolamine utilization protein [Colletotrichum truncatum]
MLRDISRDPNRSNPIPYINRDQPNVSVCLPTSTFNIEKEKKKSTIMSGKLVPLTIVKGAGHEFIPLPQGENATVADFHSIRTQTTESPSHLTSGFYKIVAGPSRPAHYTFEETKYILSGQIDILDEATGVTHHLVPGDFAFFYVGSKVQFSTKSEGLAFYAVTRPVRVAHPNLQGREEDVKSRL